MNVSSLFKIYENVISSKLINENIEPQNTRVHKILQFEVSLGELASSVSSHAYNANSICKKDSDLILTKYVQCMLSLTQLGFDYNYTDLDIITIANIDPEVSISSQFLTLYIDITDLIVAPCRDHYITLFEDLLTIAHLLDFSENVICEKFSELYSAK